MLVITNKKIKFTNIHQMQCSECGFFMKGSKKCDLCGWKKKEEKPMSDSEFFRKIWNERPHFSEVSGKPLGDEMNSWFFSHVLTKQYKYFRHYDKNIVLCTPDEHQQWEFGDRSDPKWEFKKVLAETLRREYYQKFKIK